MSLASRGSVLAGIGSGQKITKTIARLKLDKWNSLKTLEDLTYRDINGQTKKLLQCYISILTLVAIRLIY